MPFSLMIHGGAGNIADPARFRASVLHVLEHGRDLLASGATALDAVETCVRLLEDDPLFNAGRGSCLNSRGEIEMDASIMDGANLMAGAVAGVSGVRNPVTLARIVMERSGHVLLIGEGAQEFARENGLRLEPASYFLTPERAQQLAAMRAKGEVELDHGGGETKLGTVGAVARDAEGNLAAATSTGGIANKSFGRVGDSPLIGAGTYADNRTCAVSCTGVGEHFIRTVMAKTVSSLVEFRGLDAAGSASAAIELLVERVQGFGGVIVVDKDGGCGSAHSSPAMIHGVVTATRAPECRF